MKKRKKTSLFDSLTLPSKFKGIIQPKNVFGNIFAGLEKTKMSIAGGVEIKMFERLSKM